MRDRTADLLRAKQALSQLSYSPRLSLGNSKTIDVKTSLKLEALSLKGGDPAPASARATLLRLHPSHESLRGDRPPEG